jgi:hypothetical protein
MLSAPKPRKLNPSAAFTLGSQPTGVTVGDFWQWAYSDLLMNKWRGRVAEYIVARALGIEQDTDDAWAHADLGMLSGVKIEVKSSAYLQSWDQTKLSAPLWRGLKSHQVTLDAEAVWRQHETRTTKGDLVIFALFGAKEHAMANPLELSQWIFWPALATEIATESIALAQVEKRFQQCDFETLRAVCTKLESQVLLKTLGTPRD